MPSVARSEPKPLLGEAGVQGPLRIIIFQSLYFIKVPGLTHSIAKHSMAKAKGASQ